MSTPRLEISLSKIRHNVQILKGLYGSKGIELIGVTKAMCGNIEIAQLFVDNGIGILADSRISNIIQMRDAKIKAQYLLIRTPFLSQVYETVKYADISLNTEIKILEELSKAALEFATIHKVILMLELGDQREGILPKEIDNVVKEVLNLRGLNLIGIGTNLFCFGKKKPTENIMNSLSKIASRIEKKFKIKLKLISGGNSANYNWFSTTKSTGRINNLRIGESIYLGRETVYNMPIPRLFTDAFILYAEIIESTGKSSNKNRAILGIGHNDISISGITPIANIDLIGASSDHLIINTKQMKLLVGNEVSFHLNYNALSSAMTSPFITKTTLA